MPKIQRKTASRRKTTKPDRVEELKDRLIKPPNDPGPKIRGEETEVIDEYQESPGGTGVVQQALQNTGCGCCSSITGLFWLLSIGAVAVVIILAVKCGGC